MFALTSLKLNCRNHFKFVSLGLSNRYCSVISLKKDAKFNISRKCFSTKKLNEIEDSDNSDTSGDDEANSKSKIQEPIKFIPNKEKVDQAMLDCLLLIDSLTTSDLLKIFHENDSSITNGSFKTKKYSSEYFGNMLLYQIPNIYYEQRRKELTTSGVLTLATLTGLSYCGFFSVAYLTPYLFGLTVVAMLNKVKIVSAQDVIVKSLELVNEKEVFLVFLSGGSRKILIKDLIINSSDIPKMSENNPLKNNNPDKKLIPSQGGTFYINFSEILEGGKTKRFYLIVRCRASNISAQRYGERLSYSKLAQIMGILNKKTKQVIFTNRP